MIACLRKGKCVQQGSDHVICGYFGVLDGSEWIALEKMNGSPEDCDIGRQAGHMAAVWKMIGCLEHWMVL